MLLSASFSYDELVLSELATRRGIDNRPPEHVLERLKATAGKLEAVQRHLGSRLHVLAGYACPKLNMALGRTSASPHLWGWAVNFLCPGAGSPMTICRRIADSEIEFDCLAHEYGAWAHISFDPKARGQVVTLDAQGLRLGVVPVRQVA